MKVWSALACLIAAATASCSESPEKSSSPSVVAPTAVIAAELPKPPHGYDLKEGTSYAYIAGVSEEEQKKGIAAGKVLMFKYLGKRDGLHTIAFLNDAGNITTKATCSEPCVIIKYGDGSRTAFTTNSVIGSVFQDAILGYLEDSSGTKQKSKMSSDGNNASTLIPTEFQGEWNDDRASCGTGNNDTGLQVGPNKLQFYESTAEVKSVKVNGPQSIMLSTVSVGEGEQWESQMTLELSNGGEILVVKNDGSDFARLRCPRS